MKEKHQYTQVTNHVTRVSHTFFLRHKEQSSGASCAHQPVLSEKWKIQSNWVEVDRHLNKKNWGWKANCDSESWDKLPAPTPCTIGSLIPPPGVWLHWLCLVAPMAVVALPTMPSSMSLFAMQWQASCNPEALCLFGTVPAAETASLKCTWDLVLQLLSGMCPYQELSKINIIWFHICFHVCLCIPASTLSKAQTFQQLPVIREHLSFTGSLFTRAFSLEDTYLLLFPP